MEKMTFLPAFLLEKTTHIERLKLYINIVVVFQSLETKIWPVIEKNSSPESGNSKRL